uniref:Sushi domain-containing protein n=1 Tax=Anser brachyrhynchus TaxID=132585 RepID=A0A8B9BPQ3_9AVES
MGARAAPAGREALGARPGAPGVAALRPGVPRFPPGVATLHPWVPALHPECSPCTHGCSPSARGSPPRRAPHAPVIAFISLFSSPVTARCSRPKDVANAHIDVGNNTQLNACLRYTCKPGYKRKAGTSGLIQCVLHDAKPVWTPTSLQCIRKLSPAGTTGAAPTSSPSPAATPVPPVADGPSPETSTLPAMSPLLETSPPGKGMALGTTPLPTAPVDHAAGWFTSPRETTCQRGCVSVSAGSFTVSVLFPLLSELLFNAVPPSIFPFPGLPQLCG